MDLKNFVKKAEANVNLLKYHLRGLNRSLGNLDPRFGPITENPTSKTKQIIVASLTTLAIASAIFLFKRK